MQVLIDADNLDVARLRLLVAVLAESAVAGLVAAGAAAALDAVDWPPDTRLLPARGWQGADLLLARAYRADADPLLLATGDGGLRATGPASFRTGVAGRRSGQPLTRVHRAPHHRHRPGR